MITGLLTRIFGIIDRVIPDKAAAQKAKDELQVLEQTGELKLLLGQLEINKQEASHSSIFVAGWRPFLGWVCGISFAYHFVLQPLLVFVLTLAGHAINLPVFDMQSLLTVLMGMLGLGGMRSFEKFKGVARNDIKE